jgi:hypothetical protein
VCTGGAWEGAAWVKGNEGGPGEMVEGPEAKWGVGGGGACWDAGVCFGGEEIFATVGGRSGSGMGEGVGGCDEGGG